LIGHSGYILSLSQSLFHSNSLLSLSFYQSLFSLFQSITPLFLSLSLSPLQITPVKKVLRLVPESYTFMGMMENSDTVHLYQREQTWMRRLKTLNPQGLNRREELPPPIPFCMIFNDQAYEIAKLVKTTYLRIQEHFLFKSQIVSAYKRNRNLKDLRVKSKLTRVN
jgi:hypothetical protein